MHVQIAQNEDAAAQAYYQGINLAFLALVYEGDLPKAKDIASQVLKHCKNAKVNEFP